MGITIHYRGTLDDLSRIEEFEDSVVRSVFAMRGKPTIWRSFADGNPHRVIRGVIVDLAEGLDTLSLLVSPEGHFIPLFQIEDAEKEAVDEPPYCFVKTQFASAISHVMVVLLLDAIGNRFSTNLEIIDEGDYFETRDFQKLKEKQQFLSDAIKTLAQELSTTGLSREAAEDPEIVASRIERIAMLVHQRIQTDRQGDAAAQAIDESRETNDASAVQAPWQEKSLEDEVDWFENQRQRDNLRSERMTRRINEAIAEGKCPSIALDDAMRAEGLEGPGSQSSTSDNLEPEFGSESDEAEEADDWRTSVPSGTWTESDESTERTSHPATETASDFLRQLSQLRADGKVAGNFIEVATSGAMDCLGGLAQATFNDANDRISRALAITQLRRALSGHAFARGAIFALRGENAIDENESGHLLQQLSEIERHIHELSAAAWEEDTLEW